MKPLLGLAIGSILLLPPSSGSGSVGLAGRFVFSSDAATKEPLLYTERADGTDVHKLTRVRSESETDPAWSPDGTKLAFARTHACKAPLGFCFGIWVVNADGTGLARLTPNHLPGRNAKRAVSFLEPTWSPDGHRIALTRLYEKTDSAAVYAMNADGSGLRRLVPLRASDYPDWSPDGTKVVFSRFDRTHHSNDLFVWDLTSARVHRLTKSAGDESAPEWSPDGTRIAYLHWNQATGEYRVNVRNADGTGRLNLSHGAARDGEPAWSPDGAWVAFRRDDDETLTITAVDANGSRGALRVPGPNVADDPIDWKAEH